MNHNFSQTALAVFNSEKSKWAEVQFINAIEQLLASQEEVKKLKEELDKAKTLIDELSKREVSVNGS